MPRYNIHMVPIGAAYERADPVITVTLDATDDSTAEWNARALLAVDVDVQEIEEIEE